MPLIKCINCGARVNETAKKCYNCGKKPTKNTPFFIYIIFFIAIGVIYNQFSGKIISVFGGGHGASQYSDIIDDVTVDVSWDSKSGRVMIADVTVSNNSQSNVKNIKVSCNHYDKSGSRISGKDLVISKTVSVNQDYEIRRQNIGFQDEAINYSECEVTDLDLM